LISTLIFIISSFLLPPTSSGIDSALVREPAFYDSLFLAFTDT
jgi:hypothetical protein